MIEVKEPVPLRPSAATPAAPAPNASNQQKPTNAPAPQAPAAAPAMPDINNMIRRGATKASVKVASSGIHDVYFVFKSEKALQTQILMQVMGIEFKSNANL